MINMTTSLAESLELAILECFWAARCPQTGRQILAALRCTRPVAHAKLTTTLARLAGQGLLTREAIASAGCKPTWRYTARYATRGALLAGIFDQLSAQLGANHLDRAEALGLLLGVVR